LHFIKKGNDVKTPDEFVQMINHRKADPSREVKRRKPPVIIITLIFAMLILVTGAIGFMGVALISERALHGGVTILVLAVALVPGLAIMGFAGATLFACLKRPHWGRIISMVFAVAFSASVGYVLAIPDPHPLFQIAPGAEQIGAYASHVLIAFGILTYAWSMVMGSKARAYFTDV
jgi:hypothetical protein